MWSEHFFQTKESNVIKGVIMHLSRTSPCNCYSVCILNVGTVSARRQMGYTRIQGCTTELRKIDPILAIKLIPHSFVSQMKVMTIFSMIYSLASNHSLFSEDIGRSILSPLKGQQK